MGWQDAPIVSDAPAAPSAADSSGSGGSAAPAWASAPIVDSATPAASTSSAASHTGFLDELGRQLGLSLRATLVGGAQIPGVVTDAATGVVNTGLDAALGEGNGFRFEKLSSAVDNLLTQAGVPNPKNATERVVQMAAQGLAGGATAAGAGRVAAEVASGPIAQEVASQFAAGPGVQAVSGAAGGGASQEVKEKGGSPAAQIAAGIVASLAPGMGPFAAAAGTKALIRGGEEGRMAMADRIATFDAAGVDPTLAQATDSRAARSTESLLAKIPGGSGVIAEKAQQQADQLQTSVQQVADALAPGANAVTAGEAIMSGVQKFKQGFKDLQGTLYKNLDEHLPADTPVQVGNTEFALKELNADIDGAPNLSVFFKNSKIKGIDAALQSDLEEASKAAAAPIGGGGVMNNPVQGAVDTEGLGATLPYEAVKKLRTLVGNEIADNNLVSDVPRSKWTALYSALSEDLGEAAKQAGPQAEQAWQWANAFTRTQMQRLEELSSVVSKDAPERVFNAAISGTSEGDTLVKRVVNAIPKDDRRQLAAAVIQKLGRSTPGQQNAMGDAFSSETFLTNLSKMSLPARETIFGRTDVPGIMDRVQTLAAVAESRRAGSKVFSNPSGTAGSTAQIAGVVGPLAAMAAGQYKTAAALVGTAGASFAGAKLMTNRNIVDRVASPTSALQGADAAAVEAAGRAGQQQPSQSRPLAFIPMRDRVAQPAAPVNPIAAIANAQSVDEAIMAANQAVNAAALPVVTPPPALTVQPPPTVVQPMVAPVRAVPASPVSAAKQGAVGSAPKANEVQPVTTWFGRRGSGYLSPGDASMALRARVKAQPELTWRVERMPDGNFRLAGYSRKGT